MAVIESADVLVGVLPVPQLENVGLTVARVAMDMHGEAGRQTQLVRFAGLNSFFLQCHSLFIVRK